MSDQLKCTSFQYNQASELQKELLKQLMHWVWSTEEEDEVYLPVFNVRSFCIYVKEQLVGYTGVIQWPILIKEEPYTMCALSCVCTHPLYRGKGIGKRVVQEATNWIVNESGADIGLFTCAPKLTAFYEQTGTWKKDHNLILKESCRKGAYISTDLGVDVLKALLSEKAKYQFERLENATLILNFPKGEFI